MPELPEVEVTRQGIAPRIVGQRLTGILIRHAQLRWPVPGHLGTTLKNQVLQKIERRGKYLLFHFKSGCILLHLGMSGNLRVLPTHTPIQKHDHIDLIFNQQCLRLHDPRRFGALLWHAATDGPLMQHPLLKDLGLEPLSEEYSLDEIAQILYQRTRGRSSSIKQILLSGKIVVGVGNIYACESLFRARIHPHTPARKIGKTRYRRLAIEIRATLHDALTHGGSSLRDFVNSAGQPGYFQIEHFVYARSGEPCRLCATPICSSRQGQRSTFYCPSCQKY